MTAANGDEQRLTNFVQNFYFRTWLYVPSQSEVQTKVNSLVAAGQQGQTQLLTEAQNQGAQFFTSSQYTSRNRTDSEFVSDLYLAYLQRPGDPGGLSYWTSQVPIQGRTAVRNAIAASGEFVWIVDALWGAMPGDYDRTDRFLNHVFPSALNRFPSSAEQTSERSRFDTAGATGYNTTVSAGKDLGRWLFLGSEYAARGRTDHWFVYDLYQTFLRYDPDAGGWSYWEQQVAIQGRPAILEAFMATSTYQQQAGSLYREVFWLTTDHLGTPRMIAERTGSLAGIKRHDYLPFGEELGWIGGRGSPQGYVGDSTRQHFTGYEMDGETGLNFAQMRYHSATQGRFMSVDPLMVNASFMDPQILNRYSYVGNDPVNSIDPSGLMPCYSAECASGGYWGPSDITANPWRDRPGLMTIGARAQERSVAVQITRQFRYIPADAHYIGGKSWGWTDYSKDEAPSYTYSFTIDRLEGLTTWYGKYGWFQGNGFRGVDGYFYERGGGVVTDWNAQLAIGGALSGLRGAVSGVIEGALSGTAQKIIFGHGARHLAGTGLAQETVENAIRQSVQQVAQSASATGSFWGRVTVGGKIIEYRAFTMADGVINVGTYYIR